MLVVSPSDSPRPRFLLPLSSVLSAVSFVDSLSTPLLAAQVSLPAFNRGYVYLLTTFRIALTVFLIFMTNFILLIGAGLFSRAIGAFQEQKFNTLYARFIFLI